MAVPEPIMVTLDRELEDLLPLFMAQRKADLQALQAALSIGDFATIRKVGHGMSGAGASYGLDRFSALGEQLVEAARAGNAAVLSRVKDELDDYMSRLIVKFM